MARVLYVSQYFVSDDQPGGVRHWRHCRALVEAGHEVTVVTSYVQHKERTIAERYRGRRIVREEEGGMTILRFGHRGWRERVEFMAHCSMKWAVFLLSLRDLLETGVGKPSPDDLKIDNWN